MSAEQIRSEREAAGKYKLAEDAPRLVALTEDNVARVEAMIQTDSNYRIDMDNEKKSPFWIRRMGDFLTGKSRDYQFKVIIDKVVELLDKENSTHLEADKVGRREMSSRIRNWDGLLESLENRKSGFKLIDHLSEPTHPEESGRRSRRNISFASKFCHFSCFYIFNKGEDAQDNFSIYDGVVAKALPAYLDYYKEKLLVKKIDLKTVKKKIKDKDYEGYSNAIDDIIEASGSKISRNGFDHLVWYYFKGK
ncbi:MAG: hypothetical protein MJ033_06265 [Victivallaceae bacterium]|nr:hypothetical protein [Victivallaceae bacterium]